VSLRENLRLIANARIDDRAKESATDEELILDAYERWGEDCVKHLIGDFAFAIRDGEKLFCARDHFGVKPFFYTHVGGEFKFSSKLNELRPGVSNTLNEIAVGDYLLFGVNQDNSTTIFKDIQRLPPGHTLTVENNEIKIRRYWAPALPAEVRYRDNESYVERYSELYSRAVKDRLRTDRVAISMSGGLDSTSIAAVARERVTSIHAFSVVYDSLIPDEERRYSTAAANHLDIPITHLNAAQYSLFDEQTPGDMDQPEPFLLSPLTAQFHNLLRLCADFAPVALTGWDGDAFMHEPKVKPGTRIRRMLRKNAYRGFFPEWVDESFATRTNLRERNKQFWAAKHVGKRPAAMSALNSKVWTSLFEGYDPGATKLNLELRHPFLDLRLIEYLLAIPTVPWCVNKHILRRAMKNKLPEAVLNRPKTGLAGDPALQLVRRASVRWLDSFEVSPQLRAFVNLERRRPVVEADTADGLWASLRVFALNYWLTNSQPTVRRTSQVQVNNVGGIHDLNRLNCLKMETMNGT
jgi:asparagine synthase (glutamine-hydrolysing)